MTGLHEFLRNSANAYPHKIAIEDGQLKITYRQLENFSDWLCRRLKDLGVLPGDRVGIYLQKSIDSVAAMHAIMKAGAAYVPVDPTAPPSRNAFIHHDCTVRVAIIHSRFESAYRKAFADLGALPAMFVMPEDGKQLVLHELHAGVAELSKNRGTLLGSPDDLAYILYTSGSTGKPKGVMLTHKNATSFVDWCSETFRPRPTDRCSSHAPFHFDLSVLDIYMSLKHGCTLVLVPEDVGRDPVALASFIAEKEISIWYSAPSILGMLAQFGKLQRYNLSRLRLILFAGEVFPVKHLRALKRLVPDPVYYNLYGPTETNVCTFFRIPTLIPEDRESPYPIGHTCSHLKAKVIDDSGATVTNGAEGELVVCGPAVTQGYWNLSLRNEQAFLTDRTGIRWYRTGDIVKEDPKDGYTYVGRRDRMIKKRGYRIELGEIEACLYGHPDIEEAAAVAQQGSEGELKIIAFVSASGGAKLSVIALKQYCACRLPLYMVPDIFRQRPALPRTSTDKIDYQQLLQLAAS